MQWKIVASPTDQSLTKWIWTAQREDEENFLTSGSEHYDSSDEAMMHAKMEITFFERQVKRIESAKVELVWQPEDADLST